MRLCKQNGELCPPPRPPYPVYFLSPRQAAAFTLPVFRRSSDRDPRPETTRRREEQTRLVFQRQLRPLSVVDTKFSYKSIFGGTAIRRIYKFSDVGETSAKPESATILGRILKRLSANLLPKLPIKFGNAKRLLSHCLAVKTSLRNSSTCSN